MQADLIYALPLRRPLKEAAAPWPADVTRHVLSYGGGNNDGATYLGIELKTVFEGYEVSHAAWSTLVQASSEDQAAVHAFDQWWARHADQLGAECLTPAPGFLLVFDPD